MDEHTEDLQDIKNPVFPPKHHHGHHHHHHKPDPLKFRPLPPRHLSPFTLFQEVPTLQNDNMTYIEYLLGVLHYINDLIRHYNQLVDKVNEHEDRITTLEEEVEQLIKDMEDLKAFVESQITAMLQKLDEIEADLNSFKEETNTRFNDVNRNITALQQQIDNIEGGGGGGGSGSTLTENQLIFIRKNFKIRNPITGMIDTVEKVCEDLFDLHRTDGLTAQEYDDLDKTADEYDAYDMTAYQYATSAKTIMV